MVLDGILNVQTASALGAMDAGIYVVSGSTLQLDVAGGAAIAAFSPLFLGGDGAGGIGALDSLSGDNYWSGAIVLDNGASDTQIDSDAGTLFITRGINGESAGSPLTFAGAGNITIAGVGIGSDVGNMTKDGSGTLTLATDGSYTGSTTVNAGSVLDYGSGIPQGSYPIVNTGAHIILEFNTYSGASLTFSSIYVSSGATLDLGQNNVTVTGSVMLVGGTITDGTITLTGNAVIMTDPGTQSRRKPGLRKLLGVLNNCGEHRRWPDAKLHYDAWTGQAHTLWTEYVLGLAESRRWYRYNRNVRITTQWRQHRL